MTLVCVCVCVCTGVAPGQVIRHRLCGQRAAEIRSRGIKRDQVKRRGGMDVDQANVILAGLGNEPNLGEVVGMPLRVKTFDRDEVRQPEFHRESARGIELILIILQAERRHKQNPRRKQPDTGIQHRKSYAQHQLCLPLPAPPSVLALQQGRNVTV